MWITATEIAVARGTEVSVVDVRTRATRKWKAHTNAIARLRPSKDGSLLAAFDETSHASISDAARGAIVERIGGTLAAMTDDFETRAIVDSDGFLRVTSPAPAPRSGLSRIPKRPDEVALAPDGSLIAAVWSELGVLRVWDVATFEVVFTTTEWHHGLAFSPDGRWLVFSALREKAKLVEHEAGAIGLVDVRAKRFAGLLANARCGGESFAFDSKSRTIVTGSDEATACFWDVATRKLARIVDVPKGLRGETGHGWEVGWLALTPDDAGLVAQTMFDTPRLLRADTGRPVATLSASTPTAMARSSRAVAVVAGADVAFVGAALAVHTIASIGSECRPAFNPANDAIVAVACAAGSVTLFDATSGATVRTLGRSFSGASSFSKTGQYVATWDHDGALRVWSAATGEVTFE